MNKYLTFVYLLLGTINLSLSLIAYLNNFNTALIVYTFAIGLLNILAALKWGE